MAILLYLLVGIVAGSLSGLLGIGGGLIVVPSLVWLFKNKHLFENTVVLPVAVGTSLAIMIFTSSSSAYAYYKRGFISWPLFFRFAPGLSVGLLVGSHIVDNVSSELLLIFFAVFLCSLAVYLIFYKQNKSSLIADNLLVSESNLILSKSRQALLVIVSICVGILSTIFGIGGGMLMVPFFLFIGFNIREASGSSALCGVPIAILGTILLTITGLDGDQAIKSGTLGYIYWPAVLIVASTSMIFAPLGTRLAVYFQPRTLKRILAGILVLTAINIIIDNSY